MIISLVLEATFGFGRILSGCIWESMKWQLGDLDLLLIAGHRGSLTLRYI